MKITMESTDKITMLGTVPVRLWTGISESGVPCYVFVHRLAVHEDDPQEEFNRELQSLPECEFVPLDKIMSKRPARPSARMGGE